MADTLLFRGGNTADINSAGTTVVDREIVIDTDTDEIVVGSAKKRTVMHSGNDITIDSSGRVLIGTTTEGEGNADNLTIADSGNCGITIRSGTGGAGNIFFSDGTSGFDEVRGSVEYSHLNNFLKFNTDAEERLRIDDSGNVKIIGSGTVASPRIQLAETGYINSRRSYDGSTNESVELNTSSGPYYINCSNSGGGGSKFNVSTAGNVTAAGQIINNNFDNDTTPGVRIKSTGNTGRVDIKGNGGASDIAFSIKSGGTESTDTVVAMNADGSAEFTGTGTFGRSVDIEDGNLNVYSATNNLARYPLVVYSDIGGTKKEKFHVQSTGSVRIGGTLPSSPNIQLDGSDGSISASGQVSILTTNLDAFRVGRTNVGYGLNIERSGLVQLGTDLTDSGEDVKIELNPNGSITAASASFQSSTTNSWFTTGTSLYSNNYVWAAKDSGSNVWHSGLKTNGDLYLGNNLGDPNIALNGSNGSIAAAGDISHIAFNPSPSATAASQGISAYSSGQLIVQGSSGVSSGSQTTFGTYYGNVQKFAVNNAGAVFAAGSVTANGTVLTSDQRFKENITPANPQLADIKALGAQLKNFDWNADAPSSNGTRFLGLIAQDVEAVCPGIVKTIARTKQGAELTPEITDEEGNVTPATYEELDDSYKGISHDALIMKLLGAVAELSAKVAALESA